MASVFLLCASSTRGHTSVIYSCLQALTSTFSRDRSHLGPSDRTNMNSPEKGSECAAPDATRRNRIVLRILLDAKRAEADADTFRVVGNGKVSGLGLRWHWVFADVRLLACANAANIVGST